MGLQVAPELFERYAVFYRLALERQTDDAAAWVLDGATAQSARAAIEAAPWEEPPRTVIVQNCPELADLAFLQALPQLEWVCVWRCAKLTALWDMARTPGLRGLALTDCTRLRDLGALAGAPQLEHLLFQQSAWRRGPIESLMPLYGLHALRTLDLAAKRVQDGSRLAFRQLFPQIDALTITPNLRKNMVAEPEAKR